jgi:hypothetical protein
VYQIAENPVFHRRTKHIDIRFHFTREHLELGHITIPHISTKDQLADILTKPLPRPSFESFSQILVKWTTKRPWRRSPLVAYAFMLHRPVKKRRGTNSNPGVPPSVGVLSDSIEESKSSVHQPSLECDEAMSDPLPCSPITARTPRSRGRLPTRGFLFAGLLRPVRGIYSDLPESELLQTQSHANCICIRLDAPLRLLQFGLPPLSPGTEGLNEVPRSLLSGS